MYIEIYMLENALATYMYILKPCSSFCNSRMMVHSIFEV